MPEIISNTSCLIVLDNIGKINILKELYGQIFITEEVYNEFGKNIENWITVCSVKNKNYVNILNANIDLGEASTIALSLEIDNSTVILDDLKARRIAQKLNIKLTGTIGVLLKAKEKNIIDSLSLVIDEMKNKKFRISPEIEKTIKKLANEV